VISLWTQVTSGEGHTHAHAHSTHITRPVTELTSRDLVTRQTSTCALAADYSLTSLGR